MFDIGFFEIMVIMGIGMFIIGPANLPRLAKAIGKGWGEFQRTFNELKQEVLDETESVKKTANMDQLEQEISAATKVDVDVNLDTDIRPNDNP
ncbi:Sec-independent protein translocase subunit TatA/TatB [Nitrospina watsonii]|uniref:Twin-arginine translocase subunit TatB n=1 Tax=Nitrospina watsonii TaxID=1323948 RepID=A0ABM9HH65_9BACT|nr:twin-arginine translocase TatA/TatE family subunit [Nitrospina watsonii]CAI2719586.1 Twin-arginine translocase subunit TatB [Nitrospina watsonii]